VAVLFFFVLASLPPTLRDVNLNLQSCALSVPGKNTMSGAGVVAAVGSGVSG